MGEPPSPAPVGGAAKKMVPARACSRGIRVILCVHAQNSGTYVQDVGFWVITRFCPLSRQAHLQITPPGSQQGSSGAGQGSGEKEGSPSNTMPSLDSLKSIWNTTPTGVLTPSPDGVAQGGLLSLELDVSTSGSV